MIVNYLAELDLSGCTGCKRCDLVCPSGAITVASELGGEFPKVLLKKMAD